jgi:hypothetical protein
MRLFTIGTLLLASLLAPATRAESAGDQPAFTIQVNSFHITRIARDRIEGEVNVGVTAAMQVQVERVEFADLHVNGIPVFARPVDETVTLDSGQTAALPPIAVTVYVGDLDSFDPVIAMLEDRKARLTGEITTTIQPTLLERIVLWDAHPHVWVAIDRTIKVEGPGSAFERRAAEMLLRAGNDSLAGSRSLDAVTARLGGGWQSQIEGARKNLLLAESCFVLGENTQPNRRCVDQLAFLVTQQRAVASAEIGSPWEYDPRTASRLAHGGASLGRDGQGTMLQLAPVTSGGHVTSADLHLTHAPDRRDLVVLPDHRETTVWQRDAAGVYATLTLHESVGGAGLVVAPESIRQQPGWGQVAVFVLGRDAGGGWKVSVLTLSAAQQNGRITFGRTIDRAAIGSPILTPEGVIGVVQSGDGGSMLSGK